MSSKNTCLDQSPLCCTSYPDRNLAPRTLPLFSPGRVLYHPVQYHRIPIHASTIPVTPQSRMNKIQRTRYPNRSLSRSAQTGSRNETSRRRSRILSPHRGQMTPAHGAAGYSHCESLGARSGTCGKRLVTVLTIGAISDCGYGE